MGPALVDACVMLLLKAVGLQVSMRCGVLQCELRGCGNTPNTPQDSRASLSRSSY